MNNTTVERQRRYKERLYKAGLKQTVIWVKRKESKMPEKMSMTEFTRELKRITAGLDKGFLTRLLNKLLKIAKGRIEEVKLIK